MGASWLVKVSSIGVKVVVENDYKKTNGNLIPMIIPFFSPSSVVFSYCGKEKHDCEYFLK